MLIDTHAHLTDERFDAQNIIDNMDIDGLSRIITVGYNFQSSLDGQIIAKKNDRVFCAVGIHPNNTGEVMSDDVYDKLLDLSKSPKCVAIGEIGLDYHYDDTDKPKQKKELCRQLELVKQANLPVCFHLRDAYEDFYQLINQNRHKILCGGVMHCFSGSLETAQQYLDMGFYISFSGSITFKNAKKFPDIIKSLPHDRVLIETDCPYLAPDPHRGTTNYPKYVKYQAKRIADIWQIPEQEVIKITGENAFRCFKKMY